MPNIPRLGHIFGIFDDTPLKLDFEQKEDPEIIKRFYEMRGIQVNLTSNQNRPLKMIFKIQGAKTYYYMEKYNINDTDDEASIVKSMYDAEDEAEVDSFMKHYVNQRGIQDI